MAMGTKHPRMERRRSDKLIFAERRNGKVRMYGQFALFATLFFCLTWLLIP